MPRCGNYWYIQRYLKNKPVTQFLFRVNVTTEPSKVNMPEYYIAIYMAQISKDWGYLDSM